MEKAKVKWLKVNAENPEKSFGFFVFPDGSEIFAHWDARRGFMAGAEAPAFDILVFPSRKPAAGDEVRFTLGHNRRGQRKAEFWGYESDYQKVLSEIKARQARVETLVAQIRDYSEKVRLECNPNFRLLEQEQFFGKPTQKPTREAFRGTRRGTREAFILRMKPGFTGSRAPQVPLPIANGKILGGYQYVRWFERETANGWVKCNDPRNVEFPELPQLTFEMACALLKSTTRERTAKSSWSGGGYSYVWRSDSERVAYGEDSVTGFYIEFPESTWHLGTSFENSEARILETLGEKTPDVPAPPRYSYRW